MMPPLNISMVYVDSRTGQEVYRKEHTLWDVAEFIGTDLQDKQRSKKLARAAQRYSPKGYCVDEVGDYDERMRILEVFVIKET